VLQCDVQEGGVTKQEVGDADDSPYNRNRLWNCFGQISCPFVRPSQQQSRCQVTLTCDDQQNYVFSDDSLTSRLRDGLLASNIFDTEKIWVRTSRDVISHYSRSVHIGRMATNPASGRRLPTFRNYLFPSSTDSRSKTNEILSTCFFLLTCSPTLKMAAVCSFETSVDYHIIRRHIPEYSTVHRHRSESLMSAITPTLNFYIVSSHFLNISSLLSQFYPDSPLSHSPLQ
jgi:hypothetical protein